jgi:hypothetical protein
MNQLLKKIISVFFLIVFVLSSGAGQLIHSRFHKDFSDGFSHTNTTISLPHSYCIALQLMLPEFSGSSIIKVPSRIVIQLSSFPSLEISIPYFHSIKTSDRAPPSAA